MTPVPRVYLFGTLAALTPSSGAGATRLCQGCSRPPGRLPGQAAPSFTAPATATTAVVVSHPHSSNKRLMARRHVVEHQRGGAAGADRVRPGSCCQLPAVVAGLRAGQGPEQRAQADGRRADLVQNPHDLGLGRRLHDACQDHRPEPLIAQNVEPQLRIDAGQDRPEQISRRPHNPPARSDGDGTPTGRQASSAAQATPVRRSSPRPPPSAPGPPAGPPGPGRPDLGTAAHARLPAATRAQHRYAQTPRARSARPAGPGA